MKCVICKVGEIQAVFTSITLEQEGMILIVKRVPAKVCENYGESFIDDETTRAILKIAKTAKQAGVQVEICSYESA